MTTEEKWEYENLYQMKDDDSSEVRRMLNDMGEMRWELVSVIEEPSYDTRKVFYFKRKKQQPH